MQMLLLMELQDGHFRYAQVNNLNGQGEMEVYNWYIQIFFGNMAVKKF